MIELQNLRKVYDETLAVKNLSLRLPAGTVCGLVGPNGAGKTTTMRCIAGLLHRTDGHVRVAGVDPAEDPIAVKRMVAFVPDDPPLFDDLTVTQHVDFIARMYQIREHRRRGLELLGRFGLNAKLDAAVSSLSRGMRQKLAIACAYLTSPEVLLLDEPMTGLDPPGIRQLLDSVVEFARSGRTVLISSHLLAMIADVCDQLLLMQDGELRHHGTLEQLRDRYPMAHSLEEVFFAATASTASTVRTGVTAEPLVVPEMAGAL